MSFGEMPRIANLMLTSEKVRIFHNFIFSLEPYHSLSNSYLLALLQFKYDSGKECGNNAISVSPEFTYAFCTLSHFPFFNTQRL